MLSASDHIKVLLRPSGPGDLTQWTLSGAASNWQAVSGENFGTAATVTGAPGKKDLYAVPKAIGGRVGEVLVMVLGRKTSLQFVIEPVTHLIPLLRVDGVDMAPDPARLDTLLLEPPGTLKVLMAAFEVNRVAQSIQIGVHNPALINSCRAHQVWAEARVLVPRLYAGTRRGR